MISKSDDVHDVHSSYKGVCWNSSIMFPSGRDEQAVDGSTNTCMRRSPSMYSSAMAPPFPSVCSVSRNKHKSAGARLHGATHHCLTPDKPVLYGVLVEVKINQWHIRTLAEGFQHALFQSRKIVALVSFSRGGRLYAVDQGENVILDGLRQV